MRNSGGGVRQGWQGATSQLLTEAGYIVFRLDNRGEGDRSAAFKQALRSGGDAVWALFPPKRVGVLRYLDDNTLPEETAGDVRAMWAASNPGNTVVLGRAWERTPQTGQGWQNHARLREMLRTLQGTVTVPSASSVLGSLAKAPGPLDDASLDGGMIVVTVDIPVDAPVQVHRVVMLRQEVYDKVLASMKVQSTTAWNELQDVLTRAAQPVFTHVPERIPDHLLTFSGQALTAAQQQVLTQDAQYMQRQTTDMGYIIRAFRVDAESPLPAGVNPAAQHQAIASLLQVPSGATPAGGDDGRDDHTGAGV